MSKLFSHCFVVCAYKKSPHLKACLQSLAAQSVMPNILIATSTPSDYIDNLAKEFGVRVFISNAKSGIGRDWNFALSCTSAEFVTIAHQDDVYEPDYLKNLVEYHARAKLPILFYTDYFEIREDKRVYENKLLNIKRKMNAFLKPRIFWGSRFMRRRVLSMGCPICCPSVCLHKGRFATFTFDESFMCDLDWDAWSRLAQEKGEFIYISKALMGHRIHAQSETTKQLDGGERFAEDLMILQRYWSPKMARRIMRSYSKSAQSNEVL
ncbi:MAG: glycosyltransferase [Christensenellaceae bacterium]